MGLTRRREKPSKIIGMGEFVVSFLLYFFFFVMIFFGHLGLGLERD